MTDKSTGTEVTFKTRRSRTDAKTFSLKKGDDELVDVIAEYLGTSRSEAVRSSIRAFAAHLAYLQGSRIK